MILGRCRPRARTRLTLWYVGLLAGTLLVLGGLGLWVVEGALYSGADDALRSGAAAVQSNLDIHWGRLVFEEDGLSAREAAPAIAGLDLVYVWDLDGRLVYRLEGLPGLPPADPAALQAEVAQGAAYATVKAAGMSLRLYTSPILDRGQVVGIIQVGRSQSVIEGILDRLRLFGSVGLLAALTLAWVGGSFLARRALAPVDRITRAAERISADDLSRRLDLSLPDDELGRLAAAFDGMIDRLDQAFQRQRRFTADASHELRTPLAIIRSEVDVALSRRRRADEYVAVLGSVREETERLSRLTESLLVLARADAGFSLALAPLDLEEVVAEAGARVASRARERGIQLAVVLEAAAPVRGDATWLTQLLLNLLDNALRHTPPGGSVSLRLEPAPDGVRLVVNDTGEGIPPEHLPHLFERFYRIDRARSRADGGAGLGLAICAWVARAHRGRLEAWSVPGRGTTFSLWLPSAMPDHPSAGSTVGGAPSETPDSAYQSVGWPATGPA